MKRLLKHCLLIGPGESVVAGSERNHAELCIAIQHFEEQVPTTLMAQHERIGNECGGCVRNVGRRDNRVADMRRWSKCERRSAGVDADGPH